MSRLDNIDDIGIIEFAIAAGLEDFELNGRKPFENLDDPNAEPLGIGSVFVLQRGNGVVEIHRRKGTGIPSEVLFKITVQSSVASTIDPDRVAVDQLAVAVQSHDIDSEEFTSDDLITAVRSTIEWARKERRA